MFIYYNISNRSFLARILNQPNQSSYSRRNFNFNLSSQNSTTMLRKKNNNSNEKVQKEKSSTKKNLKRKERPHS